MALEAVKWIWLKSICVGRFVAGEASYIENGDAHSCSQAFSIREKDLVFALDIT